MSDEFADRYAYVEADEYIEDAAFESAPEICVEVQSRENTEAEMEEKRRLYFEAGAREVWIWARDGTLRFFDAEGQRERSGLAPGVPSRLSLRRQR